MDYDSSNEVIVLWGGVDGSGFKLGDTWEYDVNTQTWTETYPKPSPPLISGYALAYESVNNKILMTGTNEPPPGGVLHMWAYDAALDSWTERTPTPFPRGGHDMAFNGNVMVVQGGGWGMMGEIHYDDTLVYNYNTNSWTRYDYTDDKFTKRPDHRTGNAMSRYYNGVYDSNGHDGFLYLNNTYNFTANDYYGWEDETILPPNPKPQACDEHRMVFDTYHKVLIVYGGNGWFGVYNKTWVYAPGYAAMGWYVSKYFGFDYFDSGGVTTEWKYIWWNYTPANQPPGTNLKFKLQSGNVSDAGMPDPDRTAFIGPDGTSSSYYVNPGEAISLHHRWNRYIRYQVFLEGTPANTPVFDDIGIVYESAGPPFITDTDPADNDPGVPLWKNITINFNEQMNPGTVTWTISPDPGGWTEQWSNGDQTLTLNHSIAFNESTKYMVTVTGGKDMDGLDLIDPYNLNPWNFTTKAVKPFLTSTDPYNEEHDVEVTRNIVVQFSESMNHNSVAWIVSPNNPPHPPLAEYTVEWDSINTTLFLNHTTPYQECQAYTVMITAGKDLIGNPLDPTQGEPNPWVFYTFCDDPYVLDRDPEHGTLGVLLTKSIIITFSEPMNTASVNVKVNTVGYADPHDPSYMWSETWDPTDTILNLSHTVPFFEDTVYYVIVTSGTDKVGNPLDTTMGLAQWWFRTGTVDPWIFKTKPADGDTNVPPSQDIEIWFTEPINQATFSFDDCSYTTAIWTPNWGPGNTYVKLSHIPDFQPSTPYTCEVLNAQDMDGNPLVPGPVPNPWTFTTSIAPPGNLRVLKSPPHIILNWNPVAGATKYDVYESPNSSALWPWTPLGSVFPPDSAFSHGGAHDDGLTHFYIVRAIVGGQESPNSTMGVKIEKTILMSPGPQITDINWLSLPFNSMYKKASDIALELGPTKIRTVGKWDASKQKAVTRTFAKGKWRGKDFSISPGEGIFIAGIQLNFNWVIVGTDLESTLSFTYYPKFAHNINWISIPYTGIYNSASSIVNDIEFGLPPGSLLLEVGKWDPVTQSSIIWKFDGMGWSGMDFSIAPGDGIYLEIVSTFPWSIVLLTPVVP